jgi:thymidylate synthase
MSTNISNEFGIQIYGPTIGDMWSGLVQAILDSGTVCFDEGRERLALSNVRVKSRTQHYPDKIIEQYSNGEQVQAMIDFMFEIEQMKDTDVVQSFNPGAKSYRHRIKEGRMVEFVIERLSKIPESKKAVIVFPTYDDYAAVLRTPEDGYLPCLVSIQFRLLPTNHGYALHTTFYSRSMDAWQKGHGNFLSIALLSAHIRDQISSRLGQETELGPLDGIICDVHIYNEKYHEARERMAKLSAR